MNELNDYTSEQVKSEINDYETTGKVKIIKLCPGCQGGEQDNPKGGLTDRIQYPDSPSRNFRASKSFDPPNKI